VSDTKPEQPVFRAEPHGTDRFMPIGYVDGNEVWADGCCIKDRVLAERIALNMEVSFRAGVAYATKRAIADATKLNKQINPYS